MTQFATQNNGQILGTDQGSLLKTLTEIRDRLEWRAVEMMENISPLSGSPDWRSALKEAKESSTPRPLLIETLEEIQKIELIKRVAIDITPAGPMAERYASDLACWISALPNGVRWTERDEQILAEIDQLDAEARKERKRTEAIEAHRLRSGLTRHDFERKTFESLDLSAIDNDVVEKVFAWDYNTDAKGIYLCGPTGVGKTHLLKALCRKQSAEGSAKICLAETFDTTMDFLRGYTDEGFNYRDRFQRLYKAAQIVFLDDLPSEIRATDFEIKELFKVFEYCGARGKRLFFTGNYTAKELPTSIGHRNADRLLEYCNVIELSGESYRGRL